MAIQDEYTSTHPPSNVDDENNVIVRGPMPLNTPTKSTFIVLRHALASIMGRIVHHFQKMHTTRHYAEVLTLDDELLKFIQSLPPFFSLDPDTSLDQTHFYIPAHRFLLVTEILFVRVTLHRPYLLRRLGSDKYLRSRTACFECAMKDFIIRRRFLESAIKDVRDPVTSAYREFQAAMIAGIYLVLYPKGKDVETMQMILDGFIGDHLGDSDNTTRRELKIIQFLRTKAQHIAKGSPRLDDASSSSGSPAIGERVPPGPQHPEAQLLLQLASPRGPGYSVNAPHVAGPSFSNGSSSTLVHFGTPSMFAGPSSATSPTGPPLPSIMQLQRSDSTPHSGGGSPSHDDDTAQSLLDQWCNVFNGVPPSADGIAGGQSLPWATPGLGDWSNMMPPPGSSNGVVGAPGNPPPPDDTMDWNYWESLINQIRSGPVA